MTIFQENQTIGKYTVQYLIKSGEVCGTYKVYDAKENAFLPEQICNPHTISAAVFETSI